MPRISIDNYDTVASWNGSQDLFIVEQPDGTKVATPAMVKQYVLGNSIDDVYSVMGQMGAKNLNSYPYNENSHTDNGIAWTDNGDGTVTANNTATGNSGFVCHSRVLSSVNKLTVPNGTYILSGCPSGGSSTTFNIGVTITKNGSAMALGTDNGSGATITINGDDNYTDKAIVQIICNIKSGVAASNLTFKPMLRLASDTDNTYQPYAMTNKQLTEEIGDLSQTGLTGDSVAEQLANAIEVKTISGNGSYGCSYTAYKYGRVVMLKIRNVANSSTGQGMDLFYLPQGWRPMVDTDVAGRYSYGDFNIAVGGAVNFRAEAANGKVWTYSYKAFISGNADFIYICAE